MLFGCSNAVNTDTTAPENSGAALESAAVKTEEKLAEIALLGASPDDNYRTFYEIFVYSFCDSDGDGIGDLQGVISKLDYLEQLGINGIWFMPIHPSQSYHKYDVRDYYDIDPQYGTMADFEALMAECRKRDIHVITDLVVNHTGNDHEWFTTACEYLKNLPSGAEPNAGECKYVEYYSFAREKRNGWHAIEGSEWYYEGMFSPHMPDLRLENENVRSDIRDIMQFWFDKGVSGFRLDAAKEFFTGNGDKNVEVLSWLQQAATAIDPDAYMVAEVWDTFANISRYYDSGITSIFDYAFGNSDGKIVKVIRGAGNAAMVETYATGLEKADKTYLEHNPNYIDAPFLSNHDVGRIAGFAGREENKVKLAGAMNIFMGGSVFIYYGEELGMAGSGNDPSKRVAMYWNESGEGMTKLPPDATEQEHPFGSLETQKTDDNSVYNYYRQAIAIRNALPVISHGRVTAEANLNKGCVSAQRKTWGEESCIILMNIDANAARVDLSDYADWQLAASLSADGGEIKLNGTTLDLPAFGVAILTPGR
jgi:glycosidase